MFASNPAFFAMSDESKIKLLEALKSIIMAVGIPTVICGAVMYAMNEERIDTNARLDQFTETQWKTREFIQTKLLEALDKSTVAIAESTQTRQILTEAINNNNSIIVNMEKSIERLNTKMDKYLDK